MTAERREFVGEYQVIASDVDIGEGVRLSSFVNLYGCVIGNEVTIGAFVEIQQGSFIGDRCKIGSHTFICEGVTIGAGSFVGHGVMFTNDRYPQSVTAERDVVGPHDWHLEPTAVGDRVSIGSNVTILGGVTIGDGAMIGAGSVVTKDIPAKMKAYGVPARLSGPASPT